MNKSSPFWWHKVALAAIFILGDAAMILPAKNADEFTFTAFLVSVPCLLGVYFLMAFLSSFFLETVTADSGFKRSIGTVFLVFVAVFALFCAAATFAEVTDFVSKVILLRTPKFFVVLIFGATVVYFALKRQENILKFALVSFVLIAAVIIFFFISAMDKYDLRNIFIFRLPTLKELYDQIKPYVINPVLPALLLPVYFVFVFGEKSTKTGFYGVFTGTVLLGLCVLTSVLLFGSGLAGRLDFPFSSAVSTVTVGRLFTRLDGFSYFVYFACGLLKITVCLFVSLTCLKKINLNIRKGRKQKMSFFGM